jgi:hypothetical protein
MRNLTLVPLLSPPRLKRKAHPQRKPMESPRHVEHGVLIVVSVAVEEVNVVHGVHPVGDVAEVVPQEEVIPMMMVRSALS